MEAFGYDLQALERKNREEDPLFWEARDALESADKLDRTDDDLDRLAYGWVDALRAAAREGRTHVESAGNIMVKHDDIRKRRETDRLLDRARR